VNTLANNSDINGAGWPCWLATMVTGGDAVNVCSLGDAIPLILASEYATRPVVTCWLAGPVWLPGWLLSSLNR